MSCFKKFGSMDAPESILLPCIYLLDRSESMAGDQIQRMNDAIKAFGKFMDFHREPAAQIDISVILFSTEVRTEVAFQQNNTLRFPELIPERYSSLNQALLTAMDALECRKKGIQKRGFAVLSFRTVCDNRWKCG